MASNLTAPADAEHSVLNKGLALLVAGTLFMENLDATIIMPALPAMARSFGIQPVELTLAVSAYMLALGIFIPISGWATRRLGARPVFIGAIAVFTVASLACGLCTNLVGFGLMRVVQGMGGAMMVPVGRLLILRDAPKSGLLRAMALLTWPALIAPVLGPPLGGLISSELSWRWNFWINLPLGLLAMVIALRKLPQRPREAELSFDGVGFIYCGMALASLLIAAELAARPAASDVGGVLAVTGLAWVWLAQRHLRHHREPVFKLSALKIPTFAVAIAGGSLFRMSIGAIPFLLPLMLQLGLGLSATAAGGLLMAVFVGNIAIKPATTPILRRWGFKPVLIVNGCINAALIAACGLFTETTAFTWMGLVLIGGGMARSLQFTALNSLAFADIDAPSMTAANTLFSTVFQLAMGLGIAVGGISWRLGQLLSPAGDKLAAFHQAFGWVAGLALLGVLDSCLLKPDAGRQVLSAAR